MEHGALGWANEENYYWAVTRSKAGGARLRRFPRRENPQTSPTPQTTPAEGNPWSNCMDGDFIHATSIGLFKWTPREWRIRHVASSSAHLPMQRVYGRSWSVARWSRYSKKWIHDWHGKISKILTTIDGETIDARGWHWLPIPRQPSR
jgi:hypothetical protein